jgi:peptidylprolyl isomerase
MIQRDARSPKQDLMQYDRRMRFLLWPLTPPVRFALATGFVFLLGLALRAEQAPAGKVIPAPADVAAPPADAEKTASGLMFKILQKGSGDKRPKASEMAVVHYSGWTTDGKQFDSSVARNKPETFSVGGLIKGFSEALQLMSVGEKRRVWIPQELAYRGQPGRPRGMLVFDVELLDILPDPFAPPSDVAAPPADARKTPSGLAYKVQRPGKGTRHPERRSQVTVHYTGWTTDGKMFDSSFKGGQPATFGLDQVIAGWTEGVQLMVEGEKTRFWIPQRLAYEGKAGAPAGMLVFDIELIAIGK